MTGANDSGGQRNLARNHRLKEVIKVYEELFPKGHAGFSQKNRNGRINACLRSRGQDAVSDRTIVRALKEIRANAK